MAIAVETKVHGSVAETRFTKPPHNYACPELLRRIADALAACNADPAVRATVLVAQGKAFCAGAGLAGDESIPAAQSRWSRWCRARRSVPGWGWRLPRTSAWPGRARDCRAISCGWSFIQASDSPARCRA